MIVIKERKNVQIAFFYLEKVPLLVKTKQDDDRMV